MDNKVSFSKIPAVFTISMLLLSFFDWPYGYYTLLRVIVTATSVYFTYYLYVETKKQDFWFWTLVGVAILFNPIIIIHLDRNMWEVVDVFTVIFFILFILKHKKSLL